MLRSTVLAGLVLLALSAPGAVAGEDPEHCMSLEVAEGRQSFPVSVDTSGALRVIISDTMSTMIILTLEPVCSILGPADPIGIFETLGWQQNSLGVPTPGRLPALP